MINYAAGTVLALTSNIHVTIGALVNITLHPSGSAYDGPAVVVAAFTGTLGKPLISVVALADPTHREVTYAAADFPEFAVAA